MKKLAIVLATLTSALLAVSHADTHVTLSSHITMSQPRPMPASMERPIALRVAANRYSLPDVGIVTTKNCTVSAYGSLAARVTHERGKAWITFYDRAGEAEAQCEVRWQGKARQ